jgi:hypothetical protein
MSPTLATLVATTEFLESLIDRGFTAGDQRALLRALARLDANERHPSLRVHQLHGDRAGQWSASASDSLRIVFERLPDGRKRLIECSKHYGD